MIVVSEYRIPQFTVGCLRFPTGTQVKYKYIHFGI